MTPTPRIEYTDDDLQVVEPEREQVVSEVIED